MRWSMVLVIGLHLVAPHFAYGQAQSQNPIYVPGQPAPIPPPPPPPPNVYQPPGAPPKLDTYGDRVTRCLHFGGTMGLQGGPRDTYVRGCANN